jgi:hypothetical protein
VAPAGRFYRPMGFRTETGMKTGTEDSKAYFRTKPSCHASGVTPRIMKIGRTRLTF